MKLKDPSFPGVLSFLPPWLSCNYQRHGLSPSWAILDLLLHYLDQIIAEVLHFGAFPTWRMCVSISWEPPSPEAWLSWCSYKIGIGCVLEVCWNARLDWALASSWCCTAGKLCKAVPDRTTGDGWDKPLCIKACWDLQEIEALYIKMQTELNNEPPKIKNTSYIL